MTELWENSRFTSPNICNGTAAMMQQTFDRIVSVGLIGARGSDGCVAINRITAKPTLRGGSGRR